ncbi:MAG: histidine kinase dimerization/phospho-acceptor domain-containing protein, partial [Myxococcota bacterium]|nr:histidine kinase dimerization/phospho-acceptor domain-containing protein [Myxococcota bacterium]
MSRIDELELPLRSALIIVSGSPWTIQRTNETARRWFESPLVEGTPLSAVIPHVREEALLRRIRRGRVAKFDCEVLGPQRLPVEFTCTKSEVIAEGIILEGHDQSRAHSAEVMLNSYSTMIEEKTRELEAAISARDEFFSTMSHELRTPLNSMIGFSESLIDEIYGPLSEDQLTIVEKIHGSGQKLMVLLNNLLQLSRIRSGKLQLTRRSLDLEQLCLRAIQTQE